MGFNPINDTIGLSGIKKKKNIMFIGNNYYHV